RMSQLGNSMNTLARVGTEITGLPLTNSNRIDVLRSGTEAYPEMLAAIASANCSIALATYIFRLDNVGAKFVEALVEAQDRGVQIRVLVDGIGGGYFSSPIMRALENAGIEAAQFIHDTRPWRMPFVNLRNHKKLLIIDGAKSFTGGLNIGDENAASEDQNKGVDDTHFFVEGPVVAQMMESFVADWHFTTGEMLSSTIWWPDIQPSGSVVARGVSSGPDEDIGKIEAVLVAAILQARHKVRIVTPYFLPDEKLSAAVNLAGLRGVELELLIPKATDHILMDWAMRAHLALFHLSRVKCFTTSSPFDHSKLMTVDGKWGAIGSPNWDVRSLRLNFEFMLEFYGENIVSRIDALIDEKIARSTRLTPNDIIQRPVTQRLRDAGARLLLPYI
ncbi:MAG: phospholipase D-like domain-containing protein, partial [Hyphomicrobiales bacterium]